MQHLALVSNPLSGLDLPLIEDAPDADEFDMKVVAEIFEDSLTGKCAQTATIWALDCWYADACLL